MADQQSIPKILIVGGGAGGLELAIRLAKATGRGRGALVTLVDPEASHLWKPRLHEIAVGLLNPSEEQASFAELAAAHGFHFVLGAVQSIDTDNRTASVKAVADPEGPNDLLPARTLDFDTAVLALGSTVDDFGTPGVLEHCQLLDTPQSAKRLHVALLAQAARVEAGEQRRLSVAIVGAGTTGVELAAELRNATEHLPQYRSLLDPERIDVTVLEMADRPLPGVATDTSDYALRLLKNQKVTTRFKSKVTRVEPGTLILDGGDVVEADILVWASGVRGRQIDIHPSPRMERGERMRVEQTLRLVTDSGRSLENVYALGDCAACFEPNQERPVGATAQAAQQQAKLLAKSLVGQLAGKPPLPFGFRYRGTLVSLGAGKAVGDMPAGRASVRIAGVTAKLAYAVLYQSHLATIFGIVRTTTLAVSAALRRSVMPAVKLHW